jgi:hypothetical protein
VVQHACHDRVDDRRDDRSEGRRSTCDLTREFDHGPADVHDWIGPEAHGRRPPTVAASRLAASLTHVLFERHPEDDRERVRSCRIAPRMTLSP